jgi:hypothetical protein
MSKTNYLQAVISDLQRTAGPYRCATTSREQVHKNSRSLEFEFFVCSAPTAHVHWWRKFLMDILNTDCPRGP